MALNIVAHPYQYFGDPDAGRPIAGGEVYVGIVDLDPTIPANQKSVTLRQEDGTEVSVSQPIDLSAGGYPTYLGSPVAILVDGDYSLAVLDSLGVQKFYSASAPVAFLLTEANTVSVVDTVSDLTASSFDSGITVDTRGYTTVGDGGGTRYLIRTAAEFGGVPDEFGDHTIANGNIAVIQEKKRVNPRTYGLVLDGVTDDSPAAQAAYNAINTNGGGILFIDGTTYWNASVSPGENTGTVGIGGGTILLSDAVGIIEAINSTGSWIEKVKVRKADTLTTSLAIYGGGQNGGDTDGFRVIDCIFESDTNATGANVAAVNNIGAPRTEVKGCTITAGHLGFLTKFFTSVDLKVINNVVKLVPSATVNQPELLKFEACNGVCSGNIISLDDNTTGNVLSCVTFESGVFDFVFEGNTCISSVNANGFIIRIDNADSPSFPITGLQIQNNRLIGDGLAKRGIQSGSGDNSNITIRGNDFIDCSLLDVSVDAVIEANYITPGAAATVAGGMTLRGARKVVRGNTVKAGSGADQCIELTSTAPGLMEDLCMEDNVFIGGTVVPVWLKYLSGNSTFIRNTIIDTEAGGFMGLLLQAGGEAVPADTLIVANNTIKTTQDYGIRINFMNGITLYANNVNGANIAKVQLTSTDAVSYDFDNANMPLANSTQLNDITNAINTTFKARGKAVYNTTVGYPVYAAGTSAGSVWTDGAGVTVNTPV